MAYKLSKVKNQRTCKSDFRFSNTGVREKVPQLENLITGNQIKLVELIDNIGIVFH
jgi:hypothetical protein